MKKSNPRFNPIPHNPPPPATLIHHRKAWGRSTEPAQALRLIPAMDRPEEPAMAPAAKAHWRELLGPRMVPVFCTKSYHVTRRWQEDSKKRELFFCVLPSTN